MGKKSKFVGKRYLHHRPTAEGTHRYKYIRDYIRWFKLPLPDPRPPLEVKKIGTGAHGSVSQCCFRGEVVAVKTFRNKHYAAREARALEAMAGSPGEIRLIAAYENKGKPCVAMTYIVDKLHRNTLYSLDRILQIGADIARKLAYMHARNWIHRDVKCDNILVDEYGRAYLSDFSLAIEQTEHSGKSGTPNSSAPELLAYGRASPSSDIWSLGVLLYELCTNHYFLRHPEFGIDLQNPLWYLKETCCRIGLPPQRLDPKSVMSKNPFLKGDVCPDQTRNIRTRIREINPEIPDAFIALIERCISYENRPTATEVEKALNQIAQPPENHQESSSRGCESCTVS